MELFSVFNFIIRSTVISSVLICLILLIRLLFGKKLDPKLKYCIWILLLLRLLIPYAPQSSVSIYNLFRLVGYETQYFMDPYGINAESGVRAADAADSPDSPPSGRAGNPEKPAGALPVLWAAGALVFCLYTGAVNIRFRLRLKEGSKVVTIPEYTRLLQDCGQRLGVRKKPLLVETDTVQTPALYGLVHPKLLMPVNGCRSYGPDRLKYIFRHEIAHLKRLDHYTGALMRALQALYWFNPLLWLAFHIMRRDREKACDSHVLSYLRPEEYKKYGEALIHVLQGYAKTARLPAIAAMADSRREMRERIGLIARHRENSGRWRVLALICLLLLGSVVLTDSPPSYAFNGEASVEYDGRLTDRIDYPFVNDLRLMGRWQSVDFVKSMDHFSPGVQTFNSALYLKELIFEARGKTSISALDVPLQEAPYLQWTKGLILHLGDRTASKYSIKKIAGDTFMFMEWKSGDYIDRQMKPQYYVLKKVN